MMKALSYLKSSVNYNGIDEVIIVRNGYVIYEGNNTSRAHGIASCTKTFTSTVLGLLIEDGRIKLDDYAFHYESLLNEKYAEVTYRHFATMTSGYSAVGKNRWDGGITDDWSWTPYDPDEPLFAPGTAYAYWDEAQMMFGRVLTKILNRTMESYLKDKIGNHIGMQFSWSAEGDIDGVPINNGCTDVRINAKNLARWGWLFLNQGNWDGEQLINKDWVMNATTVQVPSSIPVADTDRANLVGPGCYGFNWWVNGEKADGTMKLPGAPKSSYFASGANNNRCFVIPEWNMVVVRMGTDGNIDNADLVYGVFLEKLGESIFDLDSKVGIELTYTASEVSATL
jgi:CubicO group peptidase (beta-lactamase class C family)